MAKTAEKPVRLSVPVDVVTHARLCAVAKMRRKLVSSLAADFLKSAVKDVQISGLAKVAGHVEDTANDAA